MVEISTISTEICYREAANGKLADICRGLFESIYKTPLPFVMDGFATASGNGANTAYFFARKLFHGALNFDDVQTMKSADKNRAIQLFKECWECFAKNGRISKKPRPLQAIFNKLDDALQSGAFNAGAVFHELTMPPYGVNSAAALLCIGVFIAGRAGILGVKCGDMVISLQDWADKILPEKKTKITSAIFGDAILYQDAEYSDKWSNFFDACDNCSTHIGIFQLWQDAQALKKRTPLPPEHVDLYTNLKDRADTASSKIKEFAGLEKKANSQIEEAENRGKFELYIHGAANFGKLDAIIEQEPDCWPQDKRMHIQNALGQSRQLVRSGFADWINNLSANLNSPSALRNFQNKLEEFKTKLKDISLADEAAYLGKKYDIIAKSIAAIVDEQNLLKEVIDWSKQFKAQIDNLTLLELRHGNDKIKDYNARLGRCRHIKSSREYFDIRDDLTNIQKNIRNRTNAIEKEFDHVINSMPATVNDIEEIILALRNLEAKFNGDINQQDIIDERKALANAIDKWRSMRSDSSTSNELLASQLADFERDILQAYKDAELQIDASHIYGILKRDIEENRLALSSAWLNSAKSKTGALSDLSIQEARYLLNDLNNMPAYICPLHKTEIENMKTLVNNHLAEQKLEWLVAEFIDLPIAQQREALKRMEAALA